MTLEETFHGKTLHFRVIAYTQSGKKNFVPLKVYVPPGSRAGDEIIFEGVGNERKDGTRQDISFIIKELKHPTLKRVRDDLWIDLRLPWVDELNNKEGVIYIQGVDGQEYALEVDYHATHRLHGIKTISKAGMLRYDGAARGKLVVRYVHPGFLFVFQPLIHTIRWKISPPSLWGSFKFPDVLKLKS
jgi:DnaJ family protein B protein 4